MLILKNFKMKGGRHKSYNIKFVPKIMNKSFDSLNLNDDSVVLENSFSKNFNNFRISN